MRREAGFGSDETRKYEKGARAGRAEGERMEVTKSVWMSWVQERTRTWIAEKIEDGEGLRVCGASLLRFLFSEIRTPTCSMICSHGGRQNIMLFTKGPLSYIL